MPQTPPSHSAMPGSSPDATRRRPVRRSVRDWVSTEPGAWSIVLFPSIAAWVATGPTWTSTWLVALWAVCYCVQFTAARWCKSRFRRRYRTPALTYALVLATAGVPFLVLHPGILWWAPAYVVLCGVSLLASWMRRERSLWANLAAVLAASAMAAVVAPFGTRCPAPSATDRLPRRYDPALFPSVGVEIAVGFALALFGSVLFVKTMIRERGHRGYLHASWTYHAVLVALGFLCDILYGALALVLLARAVALPLIARRRPVPVKAVGITESVMSLLMLIMIPLGA
ncbi:YwiC-like protein [Bifidobacterium italicum]|uniref:YwiC-like protein n=2 Tax=Bifidobacterium italicum TaxID=1960968 RepID=A0A2A2EM99_9BIFI|nr:YwiC-like protein [Bifidobacterium italicum]